MTRKIITAAAFAAFASAGAVHAQASGTVTGTSPDPVYSDVVTTAGGNVYYCRPNAVERSGQMVRVCRSINAAGDGMQGNIGAGAIAAGAVAVIAIAASNDT